MAVWSGVRTGHGEEGNSIIQFHNSSLVTLQWMFLLSLSELERKSPLSLVVSPFSTLKNLSALRSEQNLEFSSDERWTLQTIPCRSNHVKRTRTIVTKAEREREKEDGWGERESYYHLPKSITKTLLHVHCHALRELNPDHGEQERRKRKRGKNPFAAMTSHSPDSQDRMASDDLFENIFLTIGLESHSACEPRGISLVLPSSNGRESTELEFRPRVSRVPSSGFVWSRI